MTRPLHWRKVRATWTVLPPPRTVAAVTDSEPERVNRAWTVTVTASVQACLRRLRDLTVTACHDGPTMRWRGQALAESP